MTENEKKPEMEVATEVADEVNAVNEVEQAMEVSNTQEIAVEKAIENSENQVEKEQVQKEKPSEELAINNLEENSKSSEDTAEKQEEIPKEKPTVFVRWSYNEQLEQENKKEKESKKKGTMSYFLYFLVIMLVAVGTMFLTLAISGAFSTNQDVVEPAISVSEKVLPSVVYIKVTTADGTYTGSGFFVTSDGYIITNAHVVSSAVTVLVTTYDGKEYDATIVGYATLEDVALLKIKANVTPVTLGDSSSIKVGEIAIALGNPASDDGQFSTTQGIVSYVNRAVEETGTGCVANISMIQTDAPVNPGNSGGPLCDKNGNVIGVVSQKMVNSSTGTYYESLGLALPINGVMEIAEQLKNGTYEEGNNSITRIRPTIGITCGIVKAGDAISSTETAKYSGLYVSTVSETSDAYGKLETGDIITEIDGTAITTMTQVQEILFGHKAGEKISVTFYRGDEKKTATIELGKASK